MLGLVTPAGPGVDIATIIWTVSATLGIGGVFVALDRWRARRAVKAYRIDKVVSQVEEEKAEQGLSDSEKLDLLMMRTRVNGGSSDAVGDTAKRTENLAKSTNGIVTELREDFAEHLGWSKATTERMDREIAFVRDRERNLELRLAKE
jgi:hypothetical protein